MIIGPFALVICVIRVAEQPDGWFGVLDWIYFLALSAMILGAGRSTAPAAR